MNANKLFFILFGGWALGVGLGLIAAKFSNAALVGGAVAWLTPTMLNVLFSSRLNSAWWSVNRQEAQMAGFRTEAGVSLKFVIVLSLLLGFLGLFVGWRNQDFLSAAFSGSFLSLATFSINRLRRLSGRRF